MSTLESTRGFLLRTSGNWEDECLDVRQRALSEMPLCTSWLQLNSIPFETTVKDGVVKVVDPKIFCFKSMNSHAFAVDAFGNILCFTFGQFCDDQFYESPYKPWQPGDRIRKYQQMAPNLVTIHEPEGIGFLYGSPEEIRQRMGLWYQWYEVPITNSGNEK